MRYCLIVHVLEIPFVAYILVLDLRVVYILHAECARVVLHYLFDELKLLAVLNLDLLYLAANLLLLPLILLKPLVCI